MDIVCLVGGLRSQKPVKAAQLVIGNSGPPMVHHVISNEVGAEAETEMPYVIAGYVQPLRVFEPLRVKIRRTDHRHGRPPLTPDRARQG